MSLGVDERYADYKASEFQETAREPLSTFGLDVDTASYATFRRYLTDFRRRPPAESVRVEEFVNYFHYGYPMPTDGRPVALACEMSDCSWQPGHKLLRVALKAKEIPQAEMPCANLVFLLDVSGSMSCNGGFEYARQAMLMLTDKLRKEDRVSIVTYASGTDVRLESTSGAEKERIRAVINGLRCGGGTAGGAGLELAYRQAKQGFRKDGINRVILVTDGDFNVGCQSVPGMEKFIAEKRESGVFLSVFGVGEGNCQDNMMKRLANTGNGNYVFLDNMLEMKKTLETEFAGTLATVAKDVKIQVEFNPGKVAAYRLLGYECRKLDSKDFNDDRKDAGEMGAGHAMTAFYEIVPAGAKSDVVRTDPLKYQTAKPVASDELLTVKFRYKEPDGDASKLIERAYEASELELKDGASEDFRFASSVVECALALRGAGQDGKASLDRALERARWAKGVDSDGLRAEFIRLLETARLMR